MVRSPRCPMTLLRLLGVVLLTLTIGCATDTIVTEDGRCWRISVTDNDCHALVSGRTGCVLIAVEEPCS